MNEILEVVLPNTVPWWILILTFAIPVLIGLAVTASDYWDFEWTFMGVFIGIVVSLLAMLILVFAQQGVNEDRIQSAITKSGYTEVIYDSGDFTAVRDGERVKGILDLLDTDGDKRTYQIVIIPPVAK